MPSAHAKLSASSSARWLNCPASVAASAQYENKGSVFAEEGTCAHELAEICLKSGNSPDKYLGKTLNDAPNVAVNREMLDHVQGYIDYVKSFETKTSSTMIEERVRFDDYVPAGFGTSDAIVLDDHICHVVDLKYGKGIEVYAEQNTQAMLYALGVLQEYEFIFDIDVFELHIYQPRRNHFDSWQISKSELIKWGEWVKERAALTRQDDAPFNPSDKACQWCSHKANCKALQSFTEKVISSEFDDLTLDKPEKVDHSLILKNKSLIESWLKAVEQAAYEKLSNSEEVTGFKLVAGRSLRKWGDEEEAIKVLSEKAGEDKLYTKKFVSVPQAEKLIGKAEFNKLYSELVVKPDGKPTLAPANDKRPSLGDVSCEFDELD